MMKTQPLTRQEYIHLMQLGIEALNKSFTRLQKVQMQMFNDAELLRDAQYINRLNHLLATVRVSACALDQIPIPDDQFTIYRDAAQIIRATTCFFTDNFWTSLAGGKDMEIIARIILDKLQAVISETLASFSSPFSLYAENDPAPP